MQRIKFEINELFHTVILLPQNKFHSLLLSRKTKRKKMNSTSLEWNMAGGGGIGTASYSTSLYTQPYSHNISQEQVPNVQQDQYEPEQLYGVQHPIRLEANQFDSYSDYKAYLLLLITHYQQQLKSIQSFPNQTNYTYEMEKNVTQGLFVFHFFFNFNKSNFFLKLISF